MSPSGSKAVVVGGSLGGLIAALWLKEAGFDVIVLERSPTSLTSKGAGIALHPQCVRYFQQKSNFSYEQVSIKIEQLTYLRSPPKPPLPPIPISIRVASYNSMIAAYKYHFPSDKYFLGHEVNEIEQTDDLVTVSTKNGKTFQCDLLVCADGTESSSRAILLGNQLKPPRYSGYVAWRGIVHESKISSNALEVLGKSITLHMTKDGHVIAYPIPFVSDDLKERKTFINWIWYWNIKEGEMLDDLLTDVHGVRRACSLRPGTVQEKHLKVFKESLGELSEILQETFSATEHPFLQAVQDRETDNIAFGRVCLLGDAAFAVRPHVAVGTAKAANDALELMHALLRNRNDVKSALLEYDEKQGKVGRACLHRSVELGERLQRGHWEEGQMLELGLFEVMDSTMT